MEIYQNNGVSITVERIDSYESKVKINGGNIIWISNERREDFAKELSEVFDKLFDKYRI